jgi:hypothetical protein
MWQAQRSVQDHVAFACTRAVHYRRTPTCERHSLCPCVPAIVFHMPDAQPVLLCLQVVYTIKVLKGMTDAASVGEHVCKEAEQAQVAMVVMARHTKGAIQEFFLGSTTSYCTHHSKVPVLVLPEV